MNDLESVSSEDEAKDRNFVTALARGLDVLRVYRPGEVALSNNDIAERTGLPKPTISRLTHTLCKLDYLVVDPSSGNYRLGAGVLRLGFGVLSSLEMADRANELLRSLTAGPNSYVTVAMGERHRTEVVYVAVHRSREDVSLSMHVGSRLPLFESAMGRAILVAMPEAKRDALFDEIRTGDPDLFQRRHAGFKAAQEEYERLGYCTGYGDWRRDVNGIAVPVRSLDDGRVFAVNVGGPSFHVKKKHLETQYAERLIEVSEMLSSGQRGPRRESESGES
ncbi:IclR family transcriptional regulator [Chachezhania antarctica]|uniref:IclR family transcriptional regulator n=1 Tax=Chachezhania antarctica TaxID=2340860 RepID=UPI000EB2A7D2|nr:IclR family transcriptional regulator [Chachezhania antarctica]